jgi:hypothetical protein
MCRADKTVRELKEKERRPWMTQVIERVEAHYEVREVEMGTVYRWCPEQVVLHCNCGSKPTLTTSKTTCSGCGADHAVNTEEVLDAGSEHRVVPAPGALCALTTRPLRAPRKDAEEVAMLHEGTLKGKGT